MTYEQYWYADPLMVRAFYKADKLRRERIDLEAWLHGVYVREAIASSIGNAFLAKGKKPVEYPESPHLLAERIEKERLERQTIEEQTAFAKLYMMQMMEAGKNWGKK